ncbi:MAG TPA: ribonuclease [Gammaproteobacteria bacterium]|nr:ribonuclease [Gammaproteobacteria bacterium]
MRSIFSKLILFVRFLIECINKDGIRAQAASLTFTTLFAVVPLMTVIYAAISMFPMLDNQRDLLQNFLFQHFVPESANQVMGYLSGFSQQASQLTATGAFMLIVTTILLLVSIEKSFNHIWHIHEGRSGLTRLLTYWAVLSLGPLLLAVATIVSTYLSTLPYLSDAAQLLDKPIIGLSALPLIISIAALTLLYITVPNCSVPFKYALIGGTGVALAFTAFKKIFGTLVIMFPKYEFIYGAFAAVPLFLLWLYVAWYLVLLGVEFVFALTHFEHRHHHAAHPMYSLLGVLYQFWHKHLTGGTLSESELLSKLPMLSVEQWAEIKGVLLNNLIILETADNQFALCRDLSQMQLMELYRISPWIIPTSLDAQDLTRTLGEQSDQSWVEPLLHLSEKTRISFKQHLSANLSELFESAEKAAFSPRRNVISVLNTQD